MGGLDGPPKPVGPPGIAVCPAFRLLRGEQDVFTEVNEMKSFFVGAIAGIAVMWLWGDRVRGAIDQATADVRSRAAGHLQGAADTLQSVADTVDQGLTGTSQHRAS